MPSDHGKAVVESPWSAWLLAKDRVLHRVEDGGTIELFVPTSHLCVSRVTGRLSAEMAHAWVSTIEPHFERGNVYATFHDWKRMERYDSAARRTLTRWVIARRASIRGAEFLVASKLVAMGVAAASLATTLAGMEMVAHTADLPFATSLRAAMVPTPRDAPT